MVRRTNPKDDDWQNVKDAKKRKQIQDRLAQRARRQRLRAEKKDAAKRPNQQTRDAHTPTSDSDSSHEHQSPSSHELVPVKKKNKSPTHDLITSPSTIDPSLATPYTTPDSLDFGLTSNPYLLAWRTSLIPSPRSPTPHSFTVYSALYHNGLLQSIPCATSYSSRTPLPTPSIPLPLRPTELQLMVVHPRWIDRLPFPKMRDSLIKLRGVVDEDEVLGDIFTMPSWRIVGGGESWDPGAWRMERGWAEKWGWLMF